MPSTRVIKSNCNDRYRQARRGNRRTSKTDGTWNDITAVCRWLFKKQGNMIMMVITRYEMYDLDQIVHEIDDDAFINILPTHSVFGRFANENEQKCIEQLAYCQK